MNVTVGIPTKDRYDSLDKTLLSVALQSVKPQEVIVVDDSDNPKDIRDIPHYAYILQLFQQYNIKWRYVWGIKKGQHHSHQHIQEIADTDYIIRMDDDVIAEPDCFKLLIDSMKGGVGAVAPAVMMPNPQVLPPHIRNDINDISAPNMQWFKGAGVYGADHLYSCFLYKKGIAKYDLSLSTVAHREETIFSHSIKRAGYKLLVNMYAKMWHFRQEGGGIRTFQDNTFLWQHDELKFREHMRNWGIEIVEEKLIVLQNGLGDHYCFKNLLPELKKKYKKIKLAVTFPDIFFDEDLKDVKLISIAEAELQHGNLDEHNIYHFMIKNNWKKSLLEAFKAMHL